MKHSPFSLPLLTALALLPIATPAIAAPQMTIAAIADTVPAVITQQVFIVNYRNQFVTVTDRDGKLLFSQLAITPTIQAVLTPDLLTAASSETAPSAAPPRTLSVEDADGMPLWSTPVAVADPVTLSFHLINDDQGIRLKFTHNLMFLAPAPNTDGTPAQPFVLALKDGSVPVSYTLDGQTFPIDISPHKFVVHTAGGTLSGIEISPGATASGFHGDTKNKPVNFSLIGDNFTLNAPRRPFTIVTRDGKQYTTFPWNGHPVLIGQSCAFGLSSSGELTVNTSDTGSGSNRVARYYVGHINSQGGPIYLNEGTINLNGTKIPITHIKRDGKEYTTFPWNGHPVFIGAGCTANINSNGELIVDPPAKGK